MTLVIVTFNQGELVKFLRGGIHGVLNTISYMHIVLVQISIK
jgi:hypothetical protein